LLTHAIYTLAPVLAFSAYDAIMAVSGHSVLLATVDGKISRTDPFTPMHLSLEWLLNLGDQQIPR
jgi:hypothetical protein